MSIKLKNITMGDIVPWVYLGLSFLLFNSFIGDWKNVFNFTNYVKESNEIIELVTLTFSLVCFSLAYLFFQTNRKFNLDAGVTPKDFLIDIIYTVTYLMVSIFLILLFIKNINNISILTTLVSVVTLATPYNSGKRKFKNWLSNNLADDPC